MVLPVGSAQPPEDVQVEEVGEALTSLQLLDDLVNALQSIGTDELRVDLTTMGGEAIDPDHLTVINNAHKALHDKRAYTTHFENQVTNVGEMTVIAFNVPAEIEAHMTFIVSSTHEANAFIYRDTSIDVDEGAQMTLVNRNQVAPLGESLLTSIETVPAANEVTSYNETEAASANIDTTTELDHIPLLGGQGPMAVGADERGEQEWIFSDVQVAIMIVAATIDDAIHKIRIDFYEEE